MSTVMQLNNEELAWAAGLIDGEGTFKFNAQKQKHKQRKYGALGVSISQVDKYVLTRFRKAVLNLGKIYGPYGPYSDNKQAYYKYEAGSFEDSQAIIGFLWKWLSPIKRKQAKDSLKLAIQYSNRPQLKRGPKKKKGNK